MGGLGPDFDAPAPTIRYINVAVLYDPDGSVIHVDLELSNTSTYYPFDTSLNGLTDDKFARVNLACNQEVGLRVTMVKSCAKAPSCLSCLEESLDTGAQIECFARGCACYGETVGSRGACTGTKALENRANYSCAEMNE